MEEWRTLPAELSLYQVSNNGKVRKIINGHEPKKHTMFQYRSRKSKDIFVTIIKTNGRRISRKVIDLMAIAFLGMTGKCSAYTKDGNPENLCVENISFKTCEEWEEEGVRQYREKRPVCKLGDKLEVIEEYESIIEASRKNYMDDHSLARHCNGNAKNPLNGFTFFYKGDEESKRKAIERMLNPVDLRKKKKCV